MKSAKR